MRITTQRCWQSAPVSPMDMRCTRVFHIGCAMHQSVPHRLCDAPEYSTSGVQWRLPRMLTKHAGCTMLSVDFMLSYGYREASIARPALTMARNRSESVNIRGSLCAMHQSIPHHQLLSAWSSNPEGDDGRYQALPGLLLIER